MRAARQTAADIHSVLDNFREGYGTKNIETLLELFDPAPEVLVIGTGVDEKRTGLEEIRIQFEQDFSQSEFLTVEFKNVAISQIESVGWIAGDAHVHFTAQERALHVFLRFTGVLTNRSGKWLFVQIHFSLPFSSSHEEDSKDEDSQDQNFENENPGN